MGSTAAHGPVRVQQQAGEAACEVLHEAVRDLAQRLLHLCGELPVVMFLGLERTESWLSHGLVCLTPRAFPNPEALEHTLFLIARSRSRTDVPLYDRNRLRSAGQKFSSTAVPMGLPSLPLPCPSRAPPYLSAVAPRCARASCA